MYDQSALVREACKWDYELRFPDQVSDVLDRGWAIANSTPKGPVYLSLPREVLCEPCLDDRIDKPSRMAPSLSAPCHDAVEIAAGLLANAERPLIIAQRGAGSATAFEALTEFAERWAIPVSHYWANQIAIRMSSPVHVGWSPDELLCVSVDVVLVVNALAPWWPDRASPGEGAKVIQLGPDPLFARSSPMRCFRSDVTLTGDTSLVLRGVDRCGRSTKSPTKDPSNSGAPKSPGFPNLNEWRSGRRPEKDAEAPCPRIG